MSYDLALSLASLRLNKPSLQRSLSLKSFDLTVGNVLEGGSGSWSCRLLVLTLSSDAESPVRYFSEVAYTLRVLGYWFYKLRPNCVTVYEWICVCVSTRVCVWEYVCDYVSMCDCACKRLYVCVHRHVLATACMLKSEDNLQCLSLLPSCFEVSVSFFLFIAMYAMPTGQWAFSCSLTFIFLLSIGVPDLQMCLLASVYMDAGSSSSDLHTCMNPCSHFSSSVFMIFNTNIQYYSCKDILYGQTL